MGFHTWIMLLALLSLIGLVLLGWWLYLQLAWSRSSTTDNLVIMIQGIPGSKLSSGQRIKTEREIWVITKSAVVGPDGWVKVQAKKTILPC